MFDLSISPHPVQCLLLHLLYSLYPSTSKMVTQDSKYVFPQRTCNSVNE